MDSTVDCPFDYATGDFESDSGSKTMEEALVSELVSKNKVVVFSKSQCPHCVDSKELLSTIGVNFKVVELDKMQEGSKVQNILGQMTDARTVPRIFIGGQCVGGNSDLQTLNKTGELYNLINNL